MRQPNPKRILALTTATSSLAPATSQGFSSDLFISFSPPTMSSTGVSPTQGQESIATPSVTTAPVLSTHRSRPVLFSRYSGPLIYNMAETDEERIKREEDERKKKDEEDKKSNFKKVQEAREAAETRAAEAERKLKEREDADKKAADAKLLEDKKYEELAVQREKEATDAKAEAEAAKAEANAAKAKLKEVEDQQETEFNALLETIPEDKRPPLDATDSVAKRLSQVRYVLTLLGKEPKPPVGHTPPKGDPSGDKASRIKELKAKPYLSSDESFEMLELQGGN